MDQAYSVSNLPLKLQSNAYVRIVLMKPLIVAVLVCATFMTACQTSEPNDPEITLINGDKNITVNRTVDSPAALLISAGIPFTPDDMLLVNGLPVAHDSLLEDDATTIEVRYSFPIKFINNGEEIQLKSAASTVGQALADMGISLHESDFLNPPASTPILGPMTIEYRPAAEVEITAGGVSHYWADYHPKPLEKHSLRQAYLFRGWITVFQLNQKNFRSMARFGLYESTNPLRWFRNPFPSTRKSSLPLILNSTNRNCCK